MFVNSGPVESITYVCYPFVNVCQTACFGRDETKLTNRQCLSNRRGFRARTVAPDRRQCSGPRRASCRGRRKVDGSPHCHQWLL